MLEDAYDELENAYIAVPILYEHDAVAQTATHVLNELDVDYLLVYLGQRLNLLECESLLRATHQLEALAEQGERAVGRTVRHDNVLTCLDLVEAVLIVGDIQLVRRLRESTEGYADARHSLLRCDKRLVGLGLIGEDGVDSLRIAAELGFLQLDLLILIHPVHVDDYFEDAVAIVNEEGGVRSIFPLHIHSVLHNLP